MLLSQLMKLNYLVIPPTPLPHTDAAPHHHPPPHTQTQHHNFFRSLASFIDMSYSTASEFLKIFSNSVSAPGSFHLFGAKCNMFGSDIGVDELIALSEALQISGVDK